MKQRIEPGVLFCLIVVAIMSGVFFHSISPWAKLAQRDGETERKFKLNQCIDWLEKLDKKVRENMKEEDMSPFCKTVKSEDSGDSFTCVPSLFL